MLTEVCKRKPLTCLTNTPKKLKTEVFKTCLTNTNPSQMMPVFSTNERIIDCNNVKCDIYLRNKHLFLAMYNAHIKTDEMSFSNLSDLLLLENKTKLIDYFNRHGDFCQRLSM